MSLKISIAVTEDRRKREVKTSEYHMIVPK